MSDKKAKFIVKHLNAKETDNANIVKEVRCWYVIHTDTGGYSENEVEFTLYVDGTFAVGGESERYSVFLLPEQVELLRKFLNGEI